MTNFFDPKLAEKSLGLCLVVFTYKPRSTFEYILFISLYIYLKILLLVNTTMQEILDLASGGLLSILKFHVGAYSWRGLIRGEGAY